jgi:alpha-tubulin suppressor-like RCC1 family protein
MTATVSLGKIAFTWRGAYAAGTTYKLQDVVSYNGDSFVCVGASVTGVTPSDNGVTWALAAQGSANIGAASGDLIYFDGAQLVRLPKGTSGQVLKIDSVTGLPVWGVPETRSGVKVAKLLEHRSIAYRRPMVIMNDGTVRGWGANDAYGLGVGNSTNAKTSPQKTAFPFGFTGVSKLYTGYGDVGSRAIDTLGKLWQWGSNGYGQLGVNDTTNRYVPVRSSDYGSLIGKTVTSVAHTLSPEGYGSTCVLTSDGKVHACGYNGYGQLGQGDVVQRSVFTELPVLTNVASIYAGRERYTTYYALTTAGVPYAWGYNGEYQLGNGNATQANIPTAIAYFVTNNITVAKLFPFAYGCFALSTTGTLYGWGTSNYGCIGSGAVAGTAISTPIVVSTNVADVYTSAYDYPSTIIKKTDGTIWVTGRNNQGQLGRAVGDLTTFTQLTGLPLNAGTTVSKIVIGGTTDYGFTLLLASDGAVYATGYNANGALGVGDFTNRAAFTPVPIGGVRTVVDINTSGHTNEGASLFLLDDGQLLMSGYGGSSQVGDDDAESCCAPSPIVF